MRGMYRGKAIKDIYSEELGDYEEKVCDWVYGSLVADDKIVSKNIIDFTGEYVNFEWWDVVVAETVGMFTGWMDVNGEKLFGGDIISDGYNQWLIEWQEVEAGFALVSVFYLQHKHRQDIVKAKYMDELTDYHVIGNVIDNPEMLEAK